MSLFNKFCHTAHSSCKQSQHWPLKVVLEFYDFLGVGHKCCKIGPQLFPTTLHLVIYISNLWQALNKIVKICNWKTRENVYCWTLMKFYRYLCCFETGLMHVYGVLKQIMYMSLVCCNIFYKCKWIVATDSTAAYGVLQKVFFLSLVCCNRFYIYLLFFGVDFRDVCCHSFRDVCGLFQCVW